MSKSRVFLSEERDQPILEFLWRWKVMTTAGLSLFLTGSPGSEAVYRRLIRLQRSGFLRPNADTSGKKNIWSLTTKGFDVVRSGLHQLKEEGFKSECPGHDLLTAALQLGPWIRESPAGVEFFTEQELRRYDLDDYPDWVPQTSDHRPDGYWHIPVGDKYQTLALEVELSHHGRSKYEQIAAFYADHKTIYRVIWLVPRLKLAEKIHAAMNSSHSVALGYHDFITLDQLLAKGWQCPVELGDERGKALASLLIQSPSIGRPSMETAWILNTRKSPHTSDVCRYFKPGDFRA